MTFSAYEAEYETENIASEGDWIETAGSRAEEEPGPETSDGGQELIEAFWPHVPLLRKFLSRRVPAADLDDVLQDVLLSIVRRADAAAVVHPKCYLFQAAQAALIDRHRRHTSRRRDCHCPLDEPDHPVDELSPLRILLARDEIRAVESTLSKLPERTQEILVAVRVEGSSLKSLASRYNISTSAIEKHVTKAAKALSGVRRSDRIAAHRGGLSSQRHKPLSHSI
ncbi:RNA polymerase sigma factor [Sphingopyxis terrae]|uniref:RNA polymerase sigma factor n=1 Tax=Sphingopyxis terrae TaxID=33052 RepID=UPI003F7ED8E8